MKGGSSSIEVVLLKTDSLKSIHLSVTPLIMVQFTIQLNHLNCLCLLHASSTLVFRWFNYTLEISVLCDDLLMNVYKVFRPILVGLYHISVSLISSSFFGFCQRNSQCGCSFAVYCMKFHTGHNSDIGNYEIIRSSGIMAVIKSVSH